MSLARSGVHSGEMKKWVGASRFATLLVLIACSALAQNPPETRKFNGTWIATAQANFFRGRWSGEVVSKTRNTAHGTWALVNNKEEAVLAGTWSARKSAQEWQGTWSARAVKGRSFSGTWTADMSDGETFEDMLRKTIERQVNGGWQSGRAQGNWALQGTR